MATNPIQSVMTALGNDFVHNLKSELSNISGIANGTTISINVFESFDNDKDSSGERKLVNENTNDKRMPTAYAIITVPMFLATLYLRKSVITTMGVNKKMEIKPTILIIDKLLVITSLIKLIISTIIIKKFAQNYII